MIEETFPLSIYYVPNVKCLNASTEFIQENTSHENIN